MWLLLSCFVDAHGCGRLLSGTGAERVGREAFLRLELGFGNGNVIPQPALNDSSVSVHAMTDCHISLVLSLSLSFDTEVMSFLP